MERRQTHCGEHKKESLIFPFLQKENCQEYFRYNVLGEIIPNGEFLKWDDYLANRSKLNGMVRKATDAIEVLNLNCNSLVSERYMYQQFLMKWTLGKDVKTIKNKMLEFKSRHQYPDFIDMQLYFLKEKIKLMTA